MEVVLKYLVTCQHWFNILLYFIGHHLTCPTVKPLLLSDTFAIMVCGGGALRYLTADMGQFNITEPQCGSGRNSMASFHLARSRWLKTRRVDAG